MKKKLFAMVLCVIMVVSMAVPAFADWTLEPDTQVASSNRLNIYGNPGQPMQGRVLNLWTRTGSSDQSFKVVYDTYGGRACMFLTKGAYAINRASYATAGGKAAIMWLLSDGRKDSAFKMPSPNPTNLVNLLNYEEGLAYTGDYSGATVYFNAGGSSEWFANGSPAL